MLAPMAMALPAAASRTAMVHRRPGSTASATCTSEDRGGGKLLQPVPAAAQGLKQQGMSIRTSRWSRWPPPDMPAALASEIGGRHHLPGEPFMAQTNHRQLRHACIPGGKSWPLLHLSCVLVVSPSDDQRYPTRCSSQQHRPEQPVARGMGHRMDAAQAMATQYYNQNPRLSLRFVLSLEAAGPGEVLGPAARPQDFQRDRRPGSRGRRADPADRLRVHRRFSEQRSAPPSTPGTADPPGRSVRSIWGLEEISPMVS